MFSILKKALFVCLLINSAAYGTVTLQISQAFSGGIASGFSTKTGVTGVDGLRWGIIVDTTGNGFANSGLSYSGITGGPTASGFMRIDGSTTTDDYFFAATALTADFSALLEGDFSTAGGKGTIDEIAGVPFGTNGIGLNDSFAIVWFDGSTTNDGDYYGFLTNPAFVIPADGNTSAYDSPFVGTDAVKNANLQFGGAAVPEPSRLILLGLGFAGLIWRRKR